MTRTRLHKYNCCFCGVSQDHANLMVAGQRGLICGNCISLISRIFSENPPVPVLAEKGRKSDSGSIVCCFCSDVYDPQSNKRFLRQTRDACICSDCILECSRQETSREIMQVVDSAPKEKVASDPGEWQEVNDRWGTQRVVELACGRPFINLEMETVDEAAVALLPELLVRKYRAIAVQKQDSVVVLAMVNPNDLVAYDEIKQVISAKGLKTSLFVCNAKSFNTLVDHLYSGRKMDRGDL